MSPTCGGSSTAEAQNRFDAFLQVDAKLIERSAETSLHTYGSVYSDNAYRICSNDEAS